MLKKRSIFLTGLAAFSCLLKAAFMAVPAQENIYILPGIMLLIVYIGMIDHFD